MNPRIKELIDYAKSKFRLDNYYLKTHSFDRNVNIFNDTLYTLCMEWFPNHVLEQEDG
ncbi:lipopolysaccharide/colanic/teichoic acid biosynthesis glycosyltransferase [Bacillus capparidis]|uniref:Lipopolysaccharide/colanic/teichoic acid biosynthesis glycosyltransferase n=2 Tax=Bacillus TaxID=1386 RepID=A0ABS4CYG1_9BACI|nr:lipopolysaccharide/colanic/teichoic acid biosynthesis glycosyltransferase [Bacillus capparidis]